MKLLLPVPQDFKSRISQTFKDHVDRALKNGWWFPGAPYQLAGRSTYYGGIDYMIPTGTPIYAAANGTVVKAQTSDSGYGNHVRIQHDGGFLTIYGHLLDYSVKIGENVAAGQTIGRGDNTGFSTGPHLHFELRLNNVPVDPSVYYSDDLGTTTPPIPDQTLEDLVHSIPPFPELPMIEVVSDYINVRDAPWGKIIGQVHSGDMIKVQGVVRSDDELWLIIGNRQFIAQYTPINGVMAKWVQG